MLNMMNMQLTSVIPTDIDVLCHTFKNHILVKPKKSIYVFIFIVAPCILDSFNLLHTSKCTVILQ